MKIVLLCLCVIVLAQEQLPDLATSRINDAYISYENGDELLRFSNAIANIGRGPLYIRSERILGTNDASDQKSKATQVLFDQAGTRVREHLIGMFEFHPQHNV